MGKILTDNPIIAQDGILGHDEGVKLLPANLELSGMDVTLVNAMSRETILRQYIDSIKAEFDFVILDCMQSLGMLTINALVSADSVIIPVQAQYLMEETTAHWCWTLPPLQRMCDIPPTSHCSMSAEKILKR